MSEKIEAGDVVVLKAKPSPDMVVGRVGERIGSGVTYATCYWFGHENMGDPKSFEFHVAALEKKEKA